MTSITTTTTASTKKKRKRNQDRKLLIEVDHIIPLSKGGRNHVDNLQPILACNHHKKTNKTTDYTKSGKTQGKPVLGWQVGKPETKVDYYSAGEATRQLQVSRGSISAICNKTGKRKKTFSKKYYKWYTFSYVPQIQLLPGEEWKSIPSELFFRTKKNKIVSNMGRIKGYDGKIVYGSKSSDKLGYRNVFIGKCGKGGKGYGVHRLVLGTFKLEEIRKEWLSSGDSCTLKEYFDAREVDHIDSDPSNNKIDNLQLLTKVDHIIKTNKNKKQRKTFKGKQLVQIKKISDKDWIDFQSLTIAAKYIGAPITNISKVLRGKRMSVKGYLARRPPMDALPEEVWRSIPSEFSSIPIKYEVSNWCRVRKDKKIEIHGSKNLRGTVQVSIKNIPYLTHRLACGAFHYDKIQQIMKDNPGSHFF